MTDSITYLLEETKKSIENEFNGVKCHVITQKNLPPMNEVEFIDKKDAWIVWKCDENRKIVDLQVYDMTPDIPWRREKIYNYVNDRAGRYFDMGCVSSSWDHQDLSDIMLIFFVRYGFVDEETGRRALRRLIKIKEFAEKIGFYL